MRYCSFWPEPAGPNRKQGSSVPWRGQRWWWSDFGEPRRGEVGPWVGEMAGEVGDPIWSPVKEEAHQRGFTTATRARGGEGGITSGRPEEWWRAPARRSWSGGELGWRSLLRRRPRGKVGAVCLHGDARWTGVCDREHEEENTKGKPSALSSQMI
jgi:hypothetical protein